MRFEGRFLQRSPTTAGLCRGFRRLTLHCPSHHRTGDRIPHFHARLLDFLEERSHGRCPPYNCKTTFSATSSTRPLNDDGNDCLPAILGSFGALGKAEILGPHDSTPHPNDEPRRAPPSCSPGGLRLTGARAVGILSLIRGGWVFVPSENRLITGVRLMGTVSLGGIESDNQPKDRNRSRVKCLRNFGA